MLYQQLPSIYNLDVESVDYLAQFNETFKMPEISNPENKENLTQLHNGLIEFTGFIVNDAYKTVMRSDLDQLVKDYLNSNGRSVYPIECMKWLLENSHLCLEFKNKVNMKFLDFSEKLLEQIHIKFSNLLNNQDLPTANRCQDILNDFEKTKEILELAIRSNPSNGYLQGKLTLIIENKNQVFSKRLPEEIEYEIEEINFQYGAGRIDEKLKKKVINLQQLIGIFIRENPTDPNGLIWFNQLDALSIHLNTKNESSKMKAYSRYILIKEEGNKFIEKINTLETAEDLLKILKSQKELLIALHSSKGFKFI